MRADKSGIECSKEELTALLAFAGDDTNFGVVCFRINAIRQLIVTATDGKRAVEHRVNAQEAEPGEWQFDRTFIEALRRQTDKGETVAVIVADAKKAKAIFRGVESTAERAEIKCPKTSFSTQVSIDSVHELVAGKGSDVLTGSWFAFNPAFIGDLDKVSKAASGCPISMIPGADETELVRFRASSDRGTWRGCFKPTLVSAPGEEAEAESDPDAPGSTTQGLPSSAPPALELTNQLGTAKKRKARGSKEPAAKKPSKRAPKVKAAPEPSNDESDDSAAEAG
jgi:hypothetical protein